MDEVLLKQIGRYEVLGVLGRRAFGTLYLARDPLLDRQIAIELLMHNDEGRKPLSLEARSIPQLPHPHIVTILDVGEHNNQPFIAMEYIQGQTLAALIGSRTELPLTRKLELAEELCDGLGFAHRAGVVHGDITPANAIVDADGTLKILGFPLSGLRESSRMTHAGMLLGTPNYMSPEQLMGRTPDNRSDIFAVGAVCYELLSYKPAFSSLLESRVITRILQSAPEPLEQACEGVDLEIIRIINTALEKDPANRYQDLGQMGKELRNVRLRLDRRQQADADFHDLPTPVSATPPMSPGESSPRRPAAMDDTRVLRPEVPATVPRPGPPPATSTEVPPRSSVGTGVRALGTGIVAVGTGIAALPILFGHGVRTAAATLARKVRWRKPSESGAPFPASDQRRESADQVLLGASAPRQAIPGTTFTTRFVAYVKRLEEEVRDRLRQLDADAAHGNVQTVVGMSPERGGRWTVGTPVSVHLSGEGLQVHPEIQSFEWNGAENIVSFLVSVPRTAVHGTTQLCFEVFIEGVPVAFVPLNLAIGSETPAREPVTVTARPLSSAFASYASNDAATVALLLSALKRWDPHADVFMDCLDLTPNENWRHELERVIPTKDAFLLFWSTSASQSPWVAWELQHARSTKGLEWIRPMPIDDPETVPPPAFLQHLHFRDKFLMARQAFLQLKRQRPG